MRIRNGFLLKEISDGYAAIPYLKNYKNPGAIIALNETGAFLWQLLQDETNIENLEDAVIQRYGIEPEIAKMAVSKFTESLRECDFLED